MSRLAKLVRLRHAGLAAALRVAEAARAGDGVALDRALHDAQEVNTLRSKAMAAPWLRGRPWPMHPPARRRPE